MAGRGHRDIFAKDIEWAPGTDPGVSYAASCSRKAIPRDR